jgi:imidazolonepropionase-like amidohydrolase
MRTRRLFWFLAIFLSLPLYADAPGVYAITGGTVHPVSGAAIPNGVVVIRDGLIEAVGAGVAVPADATVIDAKGGHVYPGLFDAQTSLGFPSASPARRGRGAGGQQQARQTPDTNSPDTNPAFSAMREAKLTDDDVSARRATGVTTVLTAPTQGIFNGQSVIIDLGDGTMESRVIRSAPSQQISFNTRPAWNYPDSLMGVVAYVRQTMLDAQQYSAAHAIYDKNPGGYKRPDESASLAALGPVLRRDVPVVFLAITESMMRRAIALAKEYNLKYILSGARQSYRMADELKTNGAPVLVSVNWPAPPTSKDDRDDQPLRTIRDRQLAPTSPAALAKSGVLFALVTGPAKAGDYLSGIRKAIDNGLSEDDALKAATINPARIFGVDRQLGSLERGKIANVVVTDKPIFTKEAKIKNVIVDGRQAKLPTEDEKAAAAKRAGGATPSGTAAPSGASASAIDGGWTFIVRTPEGDVNINASLRVESGKVSGTFSGDRGSGDIRGGSFDGSTVEFTIALRIGAETSDCVFHGTLSGDSISGTVSSTAGTFQFSGSKSK